MGGSRQGGQRLRPQSARDLVQLRQLEELGLGMIVRAHQVVQEGYELFAGDRLVTVFSAPDYCQQFQNHGGVLGIKENLCCKMKVLPSKKSPLPATAPKETDKNP